MNMRFEIDTEKKTIQLLEDTNITDLISWIRATVGTQGWKIVDNRPITLGRKSPIIDIPYE